MYPRPGTAAFFSQVMPFNHRIYAISNLQFTQEGLDYMSITLDLQTESGVLPITLEVKK